MLEKDIEKNLCQIIDKLGGLCIKISSPGNNGMPDRLCILPHGQAVWVELKRPQDGRLSAVQRYQHKRLKQLNQEVVCVWSLTDLKTLAAGLRADVDG